MSSTYNFMSPTLNIMSSTHNDRSPEVVELWNCRIVELWNLAVPPVTRNAKRETDEKPYNLLILTKKKSTSLLS